MFSFPSFFPIIFQIGQAKAMAKRKAWSNHIVRHFWYCSSVCKESENTSDEEALQIMKVGETYNDCDLLMSRLLLKISQCNGFKTR